MKLRLIGLLIPAVLSGCVSHLDTKDQPATVYIDGLIADSAATLSHTQSALNQTGPAPLARSHRSRASTSRHLAQRFDLRQSRRWITWSTVVAPVP